MTPTERDTALARLREAFPESAGWECYLLKVAAGHLAEADFANGFVLLRGLGDDYPAAVDALLKARDEAFPAVADRAALLALVPVLRDLWADATGSRKSCGHEATCTCTGDRYRAALAALPPLEEGGAVVKAISMSEEDEAESRDTLNSGGSGNEYEQAATHGWAEVDALRAKLAEVEAEHRSVERIYHDALKAAQNKFTMHARVPARPILYTDLLDGEQVCRDDLWAVTTAELNKLNDTATALAASQARERELRECMERWKWAAAPKPERGVSAFPYEEIQKLLSRPTDDSALREMCERAVAAGRVQGMHDQQFVTGGYGRAEPGITDARIVNEVLGPGAAPIAAEIKEG